jgi:hypothetical protein
LLHGSRPRPWFSDHPQSLAAATRFLHGAVHGRQRPHRMPVPLATLTERHTPGIGTQCRPQPTPITVRGHHPDWVTAIQSIPNKGNSAREEFLLRPVQQGLMSQRLVIPVSGDAAQHAAHSPPLSS